MAATTAMLFVLSLLIATASAAEGKLKDQDDEFLYGEFSKDFVWATATAAYQIEGGWDEDGKGPSVWDTISHAGHVLNGDTGDVACDSYHKYMEDVMMNKAMGMSHYRFSLAWSRILPDGTTNTINQPGIDYYNNLINALIAEGMKPMVTLHHWDIPQALQDKYDGWLSEQAVHDFTEFARLCFEQFGDRVDMWITINEPYIISRLHYGVWINMLKTKPGQDLYTAGHNLIKAHAKVYHLYVDEFKAKQGGEIGITLNSNWFEPEDPDSALDRRAADTAREFFLGWFANPVYLGDYPAVMKEKIAKKSAKQGFNVSRLPEFTPQEIDYIRGTYDFFGLNFYTAELVRHRQLPDRFPSYIFDMDLRKSQPDEWLSSGSGWLKVVPWAFRRMLNHVYKTYNQPKIYVTENGVSDRNGSLADEHRIYFHKNYLNEALKAYKLDGVDVRGYAAWSLMDNFEWQMGYLDRFGLYYVDFDDDDRPRVAKDSSYYLKQIVRDNGFLQKPEPEATARGAATSHRARPPP